MRTIFERRLLSIFVLFLLLGSSELFAKANRIYVVFGDMSNLEAELPPGRFVPSICSNLIANAWNALDALREDFVPGFFSRSSERELVRAQLQFPIKAFKRKGYKVTQIRKVEASTFLKILQDDKTFGVIYDGHAYVPDEGPAYLSVYNKRKSVPLTPELIEEIAGTDIQLSKNLEFFYAASCRSHRWGEPLREILGVQTSRFLTTPPGRVSQGEIASDFYRQIWEIATRVPDLCVPIRFPDPEALIAR